MLMRKCSSSSSSGGGHDSGLYMKAKHPSYYMEERNAKPARGLFLVFGFCLGGAKKYRQTNLC